MPVERLLAKEAVKGGQIDSVCSPRQCSSDRLGLQQRHLPFLKHIKARVDARNSGVMAQDLGAQTVDRADPRGVQLFVALAPPLPLVSG